MLRAALLITLLILAAPCPAAPPCAPPVLSAVTVREETAGFSVDVEYPVLCPPRARRMVRDMAGNLVSDFKKPAPDHDLTDFPHKYSLRVRYAVWSAAAGRLASVRLGVSAYTGGAHGNHWPMTEVFDMALDRPVTLDDLFTDMGAGLAAASRLVRRPLRAALGDMYVPDMFEDGLAPMDRNFSRFVLTDEGVAFFFPPYQVAPFAAGEQTVTVPYASLAPFLASKLKQLLHIPEPVAPK